MHATERVEGKRNEAKLVLVTDLLVRLDVVVVEQLKGRQGTRLSIIPVLQKNISSRGGDSDPSALLLHGAAAIHALNERRRRHGVVAHALLNHQLEAFAQLPAGWPLERVVPPGIFDKLPKRLRPRLCTIGGFKIIVSSKVKAQCGAPASAPRARAVLKPRITRAYLGDLVAVLSLRVGNPGEVVLAALLFVELVLGRYGTLSI